MSKQAVKIIRVAVRPEDNASVTLTSTNDGNEVLTFKGIDTSFEAVASAGSKPAEKNIREHVLARYDAGSRLLRTFPIVTKSNSPYIFDPKYLIDEIAIENSGSISDQWEETHGDTLRDLPVGFQRDPFEGLGLVYPLRYIIETFDDVEGAAKIIFCGDGKISRDGDAIKFPVVHYHKVRKAINRAHAAALQFAEQDKTEYLEQQLLDVLLGNDKVSTEIRKDVSQLRDDISSALYKSGKTRTISKFTRDAIRTVRQTAEKIASNDPVELYELSREIEIVTLKQLIRLFSGKLDQKLTESHWQKFITINPFILKLAFGSPVTILGEQVSVGGGRFDNAGGKLSDYVVRSGLFGNVSIVEIKKPSTKLVAGDAYRGEVFIPSRELVGSVTQVLDQRFRLQQEINQKKVNSKVYDIYAYHVECIVIIGKVPEEEAVKKSFELYRRTLQGVVILTFDELLAKLEAIEDFLSNSANDHKPPKVLLEDANENDYEFDEEFDMEEE